MKLTKKELANKVTEVTVVVPPSDLKKEYEHALSHFKNEVEVKGFRKGQAPLDLVKKHVDTKKLQNEVINHIYPKAVNKAIKDYKIVPVMQPKIKINKISDVDFEAVLIFIGRPDVKLADYKKVAKVATTKVEKESKTPKIETAKNMAEAKEKAKTENSAKDLKNEPSKEQRVLNQTYEDLIDQSKIDLPDLMVAEEQNRLLTGFINYLAKLKVNFDDYLKSQKITLQKVQNDYKKQATRNLKLEFILSEIAKKEKLTVDEKEVKEVIDNTPDENYKKYLSQPSQKYYIESQLLKNKVANKLVEFSEVKK